MYIFGKNVAIETLKNKKKVHKVYLYTNFNDDTILSLLQKQDICIEYREKHQLDKLANGNHQGIILSVPDYKYCDIDEIINKEDALIVILDHIEDPHNLGAIIRTCESAGVDGIILPKNRSVEVNATVMRTSVGALDYMKIAQVTNINSTIQSLKKRGFWIVGTDMDGTSYSEIDYKGKIGLIVGNEGDGMSRVVKASCDFIASIPMNGHINSLNASVAAGIVIYEAVRLRK